MCDNIGVIANVANRQMGTTDLWLLTHEDLRNTARIRLFMDFMTAALAADADLLEGRRPRKEKPAGL